MKIKYLKDYPLSCIVKHYEHTELYEKSQAPKEWLNLEIVHTYIDERINTRVLVVR